MYVFNTLSLDRTYGDNDYKRLVPIGRYGLPDSFYGGRIKFIGETGTDVLLLVEYKDGVHKVIDTGAVKLEGIPPRFIKQLLDKRKIPYDKTAKKEELIGLIEGR